MTSVSPLKEIISNLSNEELVQAAKTIRKICRIAIADGRVPLEPARLRQFDAHIAALEQRVNAGR